MAELNFTHLHVHSDYSLLDGAARVDKLVERVKAQGGKAVAVTDHGNLFAAVNFYQTARKAGIKPIIGCEVYIAPGDRREKDAKGMKEASHHLLLLAENLTGYKNLLRLTSRAYREGFYYKPRVDRELLLEHHEGLICTSTCLGGEIPQALLRERRKDAEEIAEFYLKLFGEERFFIELQDHGLEEQRLINPELADLARKLGVGTVVTNDVHYLEHEDREAHEVLCCISTGSKLDDPDRFRFETDQFYLKTPQEMYDLFRAYPEALANTNRIADMCNVELPLGERHAPVYQVPGGKSADEYLRELVYERAVKKYPELTDEIRERIDYELSVIASKGFSSYFLIVWDFVNYARSRGIPCGGRGSACSTVVGYCLDLSAPDPLRYELYFERFMDPDRDEMPDIDMDICQNGREEVIEYVRQKYGHVAQIITFGTLKARAVVKDVGRVLGLGFDDTNAITKLIPEELKMTIDKAMAQEPELKRLYNENEQIRRVIDISRRLEGLARHTGIHAAAVVICDEPLDNFVPLYQPGKSKELLTQFDGPGVEACGLLKMDFLGLRTLTVIERARQLAERNYGIKLDLEKIPLDDHAVYELFIRGDTKGIFQFESGGMRDVLMKMRPNRIEDLIAANALYRPGPMKYIDQYIARKHGEKWTTPHPIMTEVLNETYGIMVYQEQVSRLVNRLGGIELKKAFRLAKAISKKKTNIIESMRGDFLDGCVAKGVARETAEQIFEDILEFGSYAFNKAHSTGYAIVAYKTAYLKHYYPTEYMAALLTFEMGSTEKVSEYIEECRKMGIRIAPPDINVSENDFTVVGQGEKLIRFGLGAIKGVGEKAVGAIMAARAEGGPFKSIFDFCERVDLGVVNRAVIEALIKCGAFDSTGAMRKGLMAVLDDAIRHGQISAADRKAGQMSLFGGPGEASGKADIKVPPLQWTEAEMLAHEKATLGFYVTSHPLSSHEKILRKYSTARTTDLRKYVDGADVTIGGLISKFRTVITKQGRNAGSKMGIVTVEDLAGQVEVVLFPKDLQTYQSMIALDTVAFFKGQVDRRREEPSVRVSEVIPLDQADEKLGRMVLICLRPPGATPQTLHQLQAVLDRFPGDQPVFLELHTSNALKVTMRVNGRRGVRPSAEFMAALDELLGPGHAVVLGPTLMAPPPEPHEPHEAEDTEDVEDGVLVLD
ncbi:MAG TPA: DNA polymerase III subunit alpha [Phycisphaerae bacterium]|nr:DNA polymerase III subunit alpha [Phycisphaerae bacterium]HOJ76070.1 DNA polymerase III subunit alpha [Phycisphaerae bacterium]HOM53435.1 DNA polymerase III subunit alpha [Phycisphaerae bacterium]HOQ86864.1 DNA polymerase III subunit alpha [Phycisphaerae bacterium]HPP28711.1 DNA polymerase III subunit alpha [Phycisphaerae bacterium]